MALELVNTTKPVCFLEEIVQEQTCREVEPLIRAHYDEVSPDWLKDLQQLKPQFDRYILASEQKQGILMTMRTRKPATLEEAVEKKLAIMGEKPDRYVGDELVGYAFFFISEPFHFSGSLEAFCDVIYVKPPYRGLPAFRFGQACIGHLQSIGVGIVHTYCQVEHDLTRFWEGLGFRLAELHFSMRLK